MRLKKAHVVRGGVLVLLALLVFWFLVIVDSRITCTLANLARRDIAAEAATKIVADNQGNLDFRPLAGDYDRVCLMNGEYDLARDFEQVPYWLEPGAPIAHRIGHRICGGWHSFVFALIKSDNQGEKYALFGYEFDELPTEQPPYPYKATEKCSPIGAAVARCFRWGSHGGGSLCLFKPE